MYYAAARLTKATERFKVPLVAGKGIFFCTLLCSVASGDTQKNEAGRFNIVQPQIQARPCLIVLAARPGNLPEQKLSVLAGLKASASGRFMAGSGSEKQGSRACFSFEDPQNKISANSTSEKPLVAAELAYKLIVTYLD
jgi:hypothetical protein